MNNFSVAITKFLLSSFAAITILLSSFLIVLVLNMWLQDGMPPFENIKFSVALFFVILMLAVICNCLKFYVDMVTDSRANETLKKSIRTKTRNEDVTI